MLTVTDGGSLSRALSSSLDPGIKRLLRLRFKQLGGDIKGQARFLLVQPGDSSAATRKALGFSVYQNAGNGSRFGEVDFTPGWEWIEDHGHCFELLFILDDSGFAHVVFIEKAAGVHPDLLRLCTAHVTVQA